jgi:aminopeptidase N
VKYFPKLIGLGLLLFLTASHANAQFTRKDSLRGSIGQGRDWWDVTYYDLHVTPEYVSKTISGKNTIRFNWIKTQHAVEYMQIDLQDPMIIDSILYPRASKSLRFKKQDNAWFVEWPALAAANNDEITIYFHGKPREATRPPWDGGWVWAKDEKGRPWMTVACQGLGASVWYPCKDHLSDEPDNGAQFQITVIDSLVAVGNGKLKTRNQNKNGTSTWQWQVVNPINNYNIVPYIGKYVNWQESYNGKKGNLIGSYWVMDYNLDRAKKHFARDVPLMLRCFEDWFGPFPFYEDDYKLVESPHLGMEHQSAIAYGNKFLDGYLGMDRTSTGWGSKFDYIIVHESGHEWFGNNITAKDVADMWIQEGFTTYSETLFIECQFGRKAADEYTIGLRSDITNGSPLIGPYGVNQEGSSDMYDKGSNLIHTIRQVIDNDSIFKNVLRGANKDFYHQTITSVTLEKYFSDKSGKDLSKIFDQYLRTKSLPTLEFKTAKGVVSFRWINCVKGFNMPVRIFLDKEQKQSKWIKPTESWQSLKLPATYDGKTFVPDSNFYIATRKAR